jgi:hypothetical protein
MIHASGKPMMISSEGRECGKAVIMLDHIVSGKSSWRQKVLVLE